jgi:glycosyltransferase involved in cell wall biosynthesis
VIGVVVPAHNEEDSIGDCLIAIRQAAAHPHLAGREVQVLVVLDGCTDGTRAQVEALGEQTTSTNVRSVGYARAVGAAWLIERGATWLAFTDADSRVSPEWLANQINLRADAVCGTVSVHDWHLHPETVRERYEASYVDRDGHRHIHGANLGVSTAAYLRAGGFPPLASNEDVALVDVLEMLGYRVAFSAQPRVSTSARLRNRVSGGFAGFIKTLSNGLSADPA